MVAERNVRLSTRIIMKADGITKQTREVGTYLLNVSDDAMFAEGAGLRRIFPSLQTGNVRQRREK